MQETTTSRDPQPAKSPTEVQYVAPQIESVTKADDLAREVLYAGAPDLTIQIPR